MFSLTQNQFSVKFDREYGFWMTIFIVAPFSISLNVDSMPPLDLFTLKIQNLDSSFYLVQLQFGVPATS